MRIAARAARAAFALAAITAGACALPDEGAPDTREAALLADPDLLAFDATGTWDDIGPDGTPVVRAWVDARVANRRYRKRVLVEVLAPHPAGWARTLHPAWYKRPLDGDHEVWGADTIEIFPDAGTQAIARLRLQHDIDGDGVDEMVMTPWRPLGPDGDGGAAVPPPGDDPWLAIDSPIAPDGASTDVVFAPFDDPGRTMLAALDELIARQRAAPGERHTLHLAVFNVTDDELIDRLIAAHQAGVEVRVVFDGRKLRPWYAWYRGDDRLIAAGVPVLGAFRKDGAMHDKLVLIDGRRAATGSFNWETGARFENHEAMFTSGDPGLVAAYAERFTALAGGPLAPRAAAAAPAGPASASFAPDEAPHRIVGRMIDAATRSIHVAMFTCKDVAYDEDDGRPTSLFAKLVAARQRGVDVRIIVDYGVAEASEYYGIVTPDDQSDEWLEARGIHVVRADNPRGRYASMHHKLTVIDGEIVVGGAFNWYFDAAYRNDEDQLVLRDRALAARATGELADLLRQYDPAWDPAEWPAVTVRFSVRDARTRWGDTVAIAGDLAALGGWAPAAALRLDPSAWPVWTGTLVVPAGAHITWKVINLRADGTVAWEPGADRRTTVPTGVATTTITAEAN